MKPAFFIAYHRNREIEMNIEITTHDNGCSMRVCNVGVDEEGVSD